VYCELHVNPMILVPQENRLLSALLTPPKIRERKIEKARSKTCRPPDTADSKSSQLEEQKKKERKKVHMKM
jgi:hypothetical protein